MNKNIQIEEKTISLENLSIKDALIIAKDIMKGMNKRKTRNKTEKSGNKEKLIVDRRKTMKKKRTK